MDLLDLILVILCAMFAFSGYRQGFVVGILSFAGLVGGAALGASIASPLHRLFGLQGDGAIFGLVTFIVMAALGQAVGSLIGWLIRRRMTWRPVRYLDSFGGAVVGAAAVLFVAWVVGAAAANSPFPALNREVNNSAVLGFVDNYLPTDLGGLNPAFRRLLHQSGFPPVFTFGQGRVVPVSPPDRRLAHSPVVRQARDSVVKVRGVAPSCSRSLEGSGFVYAAGHVMTNAHVVAGVRNPTVTLPGGASLPARVVLYDPNRDVAVLDVPGLQTTPLQFNGPVSRGASAIVLGYPENGPFTAGAARVRGVEEATGWNIYQDRQVTRQIYAIYAQVRPGNSGGPLLSPDGRVDGVVFAASTDSPNTGYALTAHEVSGDAARGADATTPVSTQGCD